MTIWIFSPSIHLNFPVKMWLKDRNDSEIVQFTRNTVKNSQNILIMGVIRGFHSYTRNSKDNIEVTIENPLNSLKIQLWDINHSLKIGDLVLIRNSRIMHKYYLDQESSIEIGHRFLCDEIIPQEYKITDQTQRLVIDSLIKWGSTQEWNRVESLSISHSTIVRTFKVKATFLKLFIINALGQQETVHDLKDVKDFIMYFCNIRCDTCQKCNFRVEKCIYCRSSLEFCTRADLPDLRMEIDTLEGSKLIRLGKWCDEWFPEIIQYPGLNVENVYKRFDRVLKKIKALKQVSMVLQQVANSCYLVDVE